MDSTDCIVNCFQNAARDCGEVTPERSEIEALIGLSLGVAWQRLTPNLSANRVDMLIEAYRNQFIHLDKTPMPLFLGALHGLEQLKDAGKWLAIATGKSRSGMERVFKECDVEHLFVASRCGDETHSKPNPQMLFDVLEVTEVDVSKAVMIGDTLYDMQMAEQAGMASLGVGYGVHDKTELELYATIGVVDSFPDIVSTLLV